MDDVKLASEMTLDGIARQLEAIRSDMTDMKADMTDMKADMTGMKADIAGLKTELSGGFRKVGEELNAAKIRDEELRGLTKFGLEAREALRQSVTARFDETDKKHDEEISLLKDVLRQQRPVA